MVDHNYKRGGRTERRETHGPPTGDEQQKAEREGEKLAEIGKTGTKRKEKQKTEEKKETTTNNRTMYADAGKA